jgi:hypothetical protein
MWLKLSKGVQLLWGNANGTCDKYQIGPATLETACEAVRQGLARLVRAYGSKEPRVQSEALRDLASAGADLHYVLFDSDDKAAVAQAREVLSDNYLRGDTKLSVTGHPDIHVPWALVYEGAHDAIPRDSDRLESFGAFWGLKYELSSTLSGYAQPYAKLLRKPERSKMLSLVHFEEGSKVEKKLTDELRKAYRALLERPVGVAHDVESYRRLIEQAVSYDTILHIFTHQAAGKIELGDDESISIIRFKMMLDRLAEQSGETPSYSLVMMNACDSATGTLDYSFVSAINRPGIAGLIGTEAVVPRDFAALFAVRFLNLLLAQGKSIGESITQLRHAPDLWPLSLLYGCYAQPDYRIDIDGGCNDASRDGQSGVAA